MIQRGHRLRSANSAPTAPPNREAVRVLGESVFFITRNLVIRADDTQVLWERNIVQLFPKTMMPLPRPSLYLATIFRFFLLLQLLFIYGAIDLGSLLLVYSRHSATCRPGVHIALCGFRVDG